MRKTKNLEAEAGVEVGLPAKVKVRENHNSYEAEGKIRRLSLNSIQLDLPLGFGLLDEETIDFSIPLPNPFSTIRGAGKVAWKNWDHAERKMKCELQLEPMTLRELSDLEAIISEVGTKR